MKNVFISCMGSRERYGMPVALHKSGVLGKFFTDIYLPNLIASASKISIFPGSVRALLSRNHPALPFKKVDSQYMLGLNFRLKVRRASSLFEKQVLMCKYGSLFSRHVAKNISVAKTYIGFSGESLEALYFCRERGIRTVVDQVDPGLYEWDLMANEIPKYPGWETSTNETRWCKSFEDRVRNELHLADEIIVNSEYSKRAMEYWGFSKNVNILPISSSVARNLRTKVNVGTLRVLFLGLLSLRKGVHIALEAVDRLVKRGFDVTLTLAGESILNNEKLLQYKGVKYLGPVPSGYIPNLLDSCDVLLFPTFSDGFGMVQIEAISRGLPVISTKNSAEVIQHNLSGFIVDIGNVDELSFRIEQYCTDRDLLQKHSIAAYERSAIFSPLIYEDIICTKFGTSEYA